jgi:protocatechuate 3,4-dioxygenase beta subunit
MRGAKVLVKLGATDTKTGVDLAVDRPNGVIKGIVTGPDGKPLADAWVSVQQDLQAMIEGMVERGPRREGAPAEGEGESRMMTIESRDEDGDGAAAAGFAPVLTDAQGRFEFTGLPHAKYEVIAEAQAGKLRGRTPNVTPDATITIQALGVTTLSGTVKGPSGPAVVFALELSGPTTAARTFTDGKFQLGRVDPGSYTVRVTSNQGNAEVKVEVVPNQPATVDITLVANAIVVGKLVDAQNQPLAGAPLTLVPDSGDGRLQVSMEGMPPTSGSDGSFKLETKAGPSVLVVLIQPRPFTKRGLVLEAGKTLDLGSVRVESGSPTPP